MSRRSIELKVGTGIVWTGGKNSVAGTEDNEIGNETETSQELNSSAVDQVE